MKTAATKPKSLRRRIVSTILWTLGLLLVTNVGWSVWAVVSWHPAGFSDLKQVSDRSSIGQMDHVFFHSVVGEFEYKNVSYFSAFMLVSDDKADVVSAFMADCPPVETAPPWLRSELSASLASRLQARRGGNTRPRGSIMLQFWSCGWPFRLLWSGVDDLVRAQNPKILAGIEVRDFNPSQPHDYILLPIRPIWTGQAFYGAFWLGVVLIVPFTRRRFRTWRGRCANCNYDLRANTTGVCPECGANML